MKKLKLFLLSGIIALTGCNNNNLKETFLLSEKYYTNENFGLVNIETREEISTMQEEKESFALYVFTTGCISCANFKPILEDYVSQVHIMMPMINVTMQNFVRYTPSVVLFKEGQVVTYLDANDDDDSDAYKSLHGFKTWFESYITIEKE